MNLDNCRECEEYRCVLSTYYKMSPKEIKEVKELKKFQEYEKKEYNRKSREYYLKEKKYYEKVLEREDKLTNYNRMNKIDRIHQNIWDLTIIQLGELQEKYYSNIKY